jgi:hypothetical protein
MCGRVRSSSTLSPGVTLILILCVCGLAVHFVAEDLAATGRTPGWDLLAQTGHTDDAHEDSEDHFIFPLVTHLPIEHSAVHLVFLVSSPAFSFSLTPQLPPPNC